MKKNVIITSGLYPTHGIYSLIKYFSYALISNKDFKKKYNLKIFIFHEDMKTKLKKIFYNFYLLLNNFFLLEKKRIHGFSYSSKEFVNENIKLKKYIHLFFHEDQYLEFKPKLILPVRSKIKEKNLISIGYIWDIQHLDLPKLYNNREKKIREREFREILKYNKNIIVNSKFVKKGLIANYNVKNKRLVQIPFLPYVYDQENFSDKNIRLKYEINDKYFIICNRFWKHKNHEVAFKAFQKFILSKPNYQLVCTGDLSDTRFPNYFKSLTKKYKKLILSNKIKILNIVPRTDQIKLIKNSEAVVQPTFYEGGPGGFSAYEALAYGKNLIISNIPINREIRSKNAFFFNPNSSTDLCRKLINITNNKHNYRKNKFYKKFSEKNKKKLSIFLLKFIEKFLGF